MKTFTFIINAGSDISETNLLATTFSEDDIREFLCKLSPVFGSLMSYDVNVKLAKEFINRGMVGRHCTLHLPNGSCHAIIVRNN